MEWGMRLRVAYCVAEAVDFCSNRSLWYNNLSADSILVDKDGDAWLSCFGLVKDINTSQIAPAESVTYRFGVVLLSLLSGKKIPPIHAAMMIKRKNVVDLMDPNLKGKFVDEEATVVFDIAYKCLYEEKESLNTTDIVAKLGAFQKITEKHEEEASSSSHQGQLEPLQTESEIPTVEMKEEVSSSIQRSPLGEACFKGDLNGIYEILVKAKYEDDKNVSECSLKEMSRAMVDIEAEGKLADDAFEKKEFVSAMESYNKVIEALHVAPPSVYARCCLSSIFCKGPEADSADADKAINGYPDWPIGYYLKSVISAQAGQTPESAGLFEKASLLEQKTHGTIC